MCARPFLTDQLEDRDEVDDIDYEESISLEHLTGGSGGLFKHKFEWENPPLEILGKEHLTTQDGYPKVCSPTCRNCA